MNKFIKIKDLDSDRFIHYLYKPCITYINTSIYNNVEYVIDVYFVGNGETKIHCINEIHFKETLDYIINEIEKE